MAVLRRVEFWPATGFPDRPWCNDPDEDAFVRSARSVCELYGAALAAEGLQGPSSTLQLHATVEPGIPTVRVEVSLDHVEGAEAAHVLLPSGVAALDPLRRGLLVLDVVHGAVVRLGQARGWPVESLEPARRHVRDRRLRFVWTGPWKASPDRRLCARAVYRLLDDGYGRVSIEVEERRSRRLVARSGETLAYSTVEGFRRSAATLRWHGSGQVDLVPYVDLLGVPQGCLHMAVDDGVAEAAAPPGALPVAGVPEVVVAAHGVGGDITEPEILFVGGGPMNGVPRPYSQALDRLLTVVTRSHLDWWSAADRRTLELSFRFDAARPGSPVRRLRDRVTARIDRPVHTLRGAPDPAGLARQDVRDLLAAVRRRMDLAPVPDLP